MENMVTQKVIVNESKHGKGIFTTIALPKNTVLFKITGSLVTFSETLNMGDDQCYCLQIGLEDFIIPDYPFLLSNHSCDPNCGISQNMEFITIKDIKKDTELVWDYSTSMLERSWTMKCNCGSSNCRKIIGDFDLLTTSVKEMYLSEKIVLAYIIKHFSFDNLNFWGDTIASSPPVHAQMR